MDRARLDELRSQIANRLSGGVRVGRDGTIGLGLFTPDGRQVGAQISATLTDQLIVSDGGETWSDLWTAGCVDARPGTAVKAKIDEFCRAYRVKWDDETNAIVCSSRESDVADAAVRIAACSLAIDGWRAMLATRAMTSVRSARADLIVRGVERVAAVRGWGFTPWADVRGRLRTWRSSGRLDRKGSRVAVTILEEARAESAIQRAFGWIADTDLSLVFVASPDITNDVGEGLRERKRVAVVPKSGEHTASAIVDAAEEVAEMPMA